MVAVEEDQSQGGPDRDVDGIDGERPGQQVVDADDDPLRGGLIRDAGQDKDELVAAQSGREVRVPNRVRIRRAACRSTSSPTA